MKRALLIAFIFSVGLNAKGQGVLAIPGQSVMITNQATQISQQTTAIAKAVELLKLTQSAVQTLQTQENQLNYMKNYMQEAEENLKHLDNIKNLKINQIENLLDAVLCVKGGDRYFQLRFPSLVNLIKSFYGKCDNTDLFNLTWAGVTKKFNESMGSTVKNVNAFVSQFNTQQSVIDQNNRMNTNLKTAYSIQQVGSSYQEQTQVELAMKYKQMSDELMKMSHQLNQALNLEGEDAVQVTKGERLLLLSKAMDYQLKSLEYEEKYAELLKEGTALSPNDRKELSGYHQAMGMNEVLMFRR